MKKKLIVNAVAIGILLMGIMVIIWRFCDTRYEMTDDAQVEHYLLPINVKVPGYIREIRFAEHQQVMKGDTLVIIDEREYAIALKQAEASLLDARSGRKVVEGTLATVTSSATVFDSSIREAELRAEKLSRDYERHVKLLAKKASTPVIVEHYKTELDMANAKVAALRQQRETACSSVGEVSQRRENAEAAILRAEAAVDMARLNLSYTVITAPSDGFVGRRSIEEGQLVAHGQTLTTLIPDTQKWVVANFKETQMARICQGQTVKISVDAIPDKVFTGTVTAISSATGSKYSLLPTDNSAGNFVKIQQRVPVRIDFSDTLCIEDSRRMAAGMMCEVSIDVKGCK
ncbi:MAG: HlyD family secretion protein [Muribaculaceae bacterium]